MQDVIAAADELERCVRDLGLCGAMTNGYINGAYLDDPAIDSFWARAEALGVPIHLHPADPSCPYPALAGCSSLKRVMWEWGVETGSHALRLLFGGVFDRFPGVTVILGHLGETPAVSSLALRQSSRDLRPPAEEAAIRVHPRAGCRDDVRDVLGGAPHVRRQRARHRPTRVLRTPSCLRLVRCSDRDVTADVLKLRPTELEGICLIERFCNQSAHAARGHWLCSSPRRERRAQSSVWLAPSERGVSASARPGLHLRNLLWELARTSPPLI